MSYKNHKSTLITLLKCTNTYTHTKCTKFNGSTHLKVINTNIKVIKWLVHLKSY